MSEYNETPPQIPISISKDQTGEKPQLPENVKIALELLKRFEISQRVVTGGTWNEFDGKTQRETGEVGVYWTTEVQHLPEGEHITTTTYYRVRRDGSVIVETSQHKTVPKKIDQRGTVMYVAEPMVEPTSIFEHLFEPQRLGAELIKDEKDPNRVMGLRFLELRPKTPQKGEPKEPSPTPPPSE